MIVEARQPVRQPSRARLEERNAQFGMAFERAVEHERRHRRHLLHRMRQRVTSCERREAISADRRTAQPEAFVDRHREPELHTPRPQRVVRRIAEVASVEMVGSRQNPDETQLLRSGRFLDGQLDVGQRHQRDAGHAIAVGRAVLRDPVVVRAARRRRLLGTQTRKEGHEQSDRRIEDDGVDALRVHRPHV